MRSRKIITFVPGLLPGALHEGPGRLPHSPFSWLCTCLFLLTSSKSLSHTWGRSSILRWLQYSRASVMFASEIVRGGRCSLPYNLHEFSISGKPFLSPEYFMTSLRSNGGHTKVPPIPHATSPSLPSCSFSMALPVSAIVRMTLCFWAIVIVSSESLLLCSSKQVLRDT